jgi:hypothetical protein
MYPSGNAYQSLMIGNAIRIFVRFLIGLRTGILVMGWLRGLL